jgi:hypothetical protein
MSGPKVGLRRAKQHLLAKLETPQGGSVNRHMPEDRKPQVELQLTNTAYLNTRGEMMPSWHFASGRIGEVVSDTTQFHQSRHRCSWSVERFAVKRFIGLFGGALLNRGLSTATPTAPAALPSATLSIHRC